jgi:hypothetical protein
LFVITQDHGTWGTPTVVPGSTALGLPLDSLLCCPSPGDCTLGGSYFTRQAGGKLLVLAEKNGTWGRPQPLPGIAALNTGKLADLTGLACFPAGDCTAPGDYIIGHHRNDVAAIFVTAEKNGTWGQPERVPGSLTDLGTVAYLTAMSCTGPGNCTIGGYYWTKTGDQPFADTQKNGTWRKATPLRIQP